MFKYLKNKFINCLDNIIKKSCTMTDRDWEKYNNYIRQKSRDKENITIGNFSQKGFNYIFYELVENADSSLIFFIKDYESIFDDCKLNCLKIICKKFDRLRGEIKIFTFNNEKNEKFLELEKEYKCFSYIPLKTTSKKANNFIIADTKAYWLEDYTTMIRTDINNNNEFLKDCINFNDNKKAYDLYNIIRQIERTL